MVTTLFKAHLDIPVNSDMTRELNQGSSSRQQLTQLSVIYNIDWSVVLSDPFDEMGTKI